MVITTKLVNVFMRDASALGGLPFYIFFTAFLLGIGDSGLALELLAGFAVSYLICFIIRLKWYKDRPIKETYTNWLEKVDAASFPSLHSYRITMMTFLTWLYYRGLWLGILLLAVAFIVMLSRYTLKRHFVSDIAVGGSLGIATALAVARFL